MAHRIGPTPQLSQPRSNSADDVRGLALQMFKDSIDLRSRLILAMPKDGAEDMEAPLPLQEVATASLPSAALWEGAIVYDTTTNEVKFSNGSAWIVIADNAITTAKIIDDAVTNAKLANMAEATIKGRAAGAGTGDPTDLSAAQVRTIVASAPATIASGTPTSTAITITDIPQTFSAIHLQLTTSSDTATRHLQVQASTDNGSTWFTTASDYVGFTVSDAAALTYISEATFIQTADVAAANSHIVGITFHGYANAGHVTAIGRLSNGTTNYAVQCTLAKFVAMNALRVIWNGSGNFDTGTYSLTGIY